MQDKGLEPGDITGIQDIWKLPFLSKDDLREAYPYGLLAEPLDNCVRIHSTSGTTGRRVVAFYNTHRFFILLFTPRQILTFGTNAAPEPSWQPEEPIRTFAI